MVEPKKGYPAREKLLLFFATLWITFLALLYTYVNHNIAKESAPLVLLKKEYQERLSRKTIEYKSLKEQVSSLSDPAAGEKALIEELGVVPKGMQRVICQPIPER